MKKLFIYIILPIFFTALSMTIKEIQNKESGFVEIMPESVPLGGISAYVPASSASGTSVKKNAKAEIDYSNVKDGYVMVRSVAKTRNELKAIVKTPGGNSYTYILNKSGNYEIFPLSEGNGRYQVGVYESIKGTKYATVVNAEFNVALKDEFLPFLRPNQYVNYSNTSAVVSKAVDIAGGSAGLVDKVKSVYSYVTGNITYDKEFAATVQSGYLTDVDAVLKKGKGICFDYAAVTAAMLRSQQIPTKLVIGYSGNAYHAWINVYSSEKGWIDKAIYFDGVNWTLMDPTFSANKSMKNAASASYAAKLIY